MKFTIRDLLWLTVVVALGVAWWIDHRSQAECIDVLREHAEKLWPLNSDNYDSLGQIGVVRLRKLPPGCGE